MDHIRALLFRWSARDILAVLALAVIVAFLTGGALFYTAANDKPAEIAKEFNPAGQVAEYESVSRAHTVADENAVVLRFAETEQKGRLLVAITESDREQAEQIGLSLPALPSSGVGSARAETTGTTSIRFGEVRHSVRVTQVSDAGMLPDRWYLGNGTLTDEVGPTGALVLSESIGASPEGDGESSSVIRGTLLFFELGTSQVLRGFAVLVGVAAILGGITVASVVGMTVRDRARTIQVIRATGGTRVTVLGLFAFRGALLASVAVALGYAFGMITASVVTSIAVFAELPTTLSPRVDSETARLLAVMYTPVVAVGFVAGAGAALPVVRQPPARLTEPATPTGTAGIAGRLHGRIPMLKPLHPRILDWRAVLPTAATVAVFVAIVFLVVGGGVIAQPLASTDEATVLEPGAAHPVVSTVPESYATAYASQNVSASPEILLFGVVDDEPTILRGGEYESFAAVSDATLVEGRPNQRAEEAVVGVDYARTHDVDVGETIVLGSGVRETVERVTVVGTYRAPGAYDDQILVSLSSARHLTAVQTGNVNFVRLSEAMTGESTGPAIRVVSSGVTGGATTDRVGISVEVVNIADSNQTREITVSLGTQTVTKSVTVPAGQRESIGVEFAPDSPGSYFLSAGPFNRTVEVRDPNAVSIQGIPETVPPGSVPLIRVTTATGAPAQNATVIVGNRTYRTNTEGAVRVRFPERGRQTVRAVSGTHTAETPVTVSEDATRDLQATVTIEPKPVEEFARPTAQVQLYNPWNRTATATLGIQTPESSEKQTIQLASGAETQYETVLSRLPAGEYAVEASVNGTTVTETSYSVVGNDRLATVVARTTDTSTGGGLGTAVSVVFGNLSVVIGALVALAALMVSGTLATSFARAIHARKRTLGVYRATGASPVTIVAIIVRDTLLIGAVSVLLGMGLGIALLSALDSLDLLVFYGIRVSPPVTPGILLAVGGVAMVLVLIGALVPTLAMLRDAPADSFRTLSRPARERRHE